MPYPTTRKYPRTMEEAFGPYQRGPISEPVRPMDWQDKLVLGASIAAAVACFVVIVVWGGA